MAGKQDRLRLDVLLVERGLAPSRQRAQAALLAGLVRVDGRREEKPGTLLTRGARIEIVADALPYAGRGGLKLEGALDEIAISVEGRICLDIGSSAGGFTDCLLQRGARKVYAVDVTISQLDWKLRNDPRVAAIERNARFLRPGDIPGAADVITMDVSFISATKILPALGALAAATADLLVLVKPQFELGREEVGKGGIVRDPLLHQKAIERVSMAASAAGWQILAVKPSRITGAEGNQEFFLHARLRV